MSREALLAVALALLAPCCARPGAAAGPAAPAPAHPRDTLAGVPAFVAYTAHETLVVPVSDAAPSRAPGLWVLGEGEVARAEILDAADVAAALVCPPGPAEEGACPDDEAPQVVVARRSVEPDGRLGAPRYEPPLDGCSCFAAQEPDPEGEEDPCAFMMRPPRAEPLSLVGGILYLAWLGDNEGCSGVHIVDAIVEEVVLDATAPAPGPPAAAPDETLRCYPSIPFGAWDLESLGEPCPPDDAPEDEIEAAGCGLCAHGEVDASALLLSSGRLLTLELMATSAMGEALVVRASPATDATCPSERDPCGPPAGFPRLDAAERFWVANDGRAALVRTADGLALLRAGSPTPSPAVPAGDRILGVRHHPDVRPFLAAIRAWTEPLLPAAVSP